MDNMNYLHQSENDLPLVDRDGKKYMDSRTIAEALQVEHGNLIEGIRKYQSTIEDQFGPVPFETGSRNDGNLGGKQPTYALLTEDQALFVGTLSRNTSKVVKFKYKLVQTFQKARAAAQQLIKDLTRKDLALMILEAEKELEQVKQIIQEQEPLVQLAERYLNNPGFNFDIGDIAASITINGKPLGRNTLFRMMREAGYLYHDHSQNHHVKAGFTHLFKVIPITDEEHNRTFNKVRASAEGAMLLINKFSQDKSTPETRQKFTLLKAS